MKREIDTIERANAIIDDYQACVTNPVHTECKRCACHVPESGCYELFYKACIFMRDNNVLVDSKRAL